ncbi:DNA mismatch repair protein Mlh3 MutL protein -like protein 3 [Channa argus]|uniref:DNA mismatch repair protein Mlh3 MutL protein-like protein 3 n=1 Tax=Channa argus TaxID=215402 RepID=A0A6G1QGP7_CHAAH|nr:DNA mismatch repair protein Mlh3 MutL protein -like protein 3 [Channa argus]
MIKCLPKEVQGKLRSGVAIPSFQQCVEELILNSIDAGATCVGVRMDMEAFKVQVIDNGAGMSVEDIKCVGNRYHTSKCGTVEDLDNLKWYGFRGEALASIVSLATLVEISSRTRSSLKTHVKVFKDGKSLDVFEAETARPSAGTTVVICNFFHNMPVRRKRMDAVLEGERIRHRVEAISLMHPSVSFTLKNDCTGAMMVQLCKAKNTYQRFVQIHSLGRAQKMREISYSLGGFEVIGYIGREGHYNNSLQFLYINERLLLKTRIHKLLNLLLRRLSSSTQKNDSPDGQSAIRSPKHKRSQELHGVYVINIKCSYSEYDICLEPAKTLIEFKDWDGILLCIEGAVKAFLRSENLVAVLCEDDLDYVSPKLFGADITEQDEGTGGLATRSAATLDCSLGIKLASDSVHRKRSDGVSQSSICLMSDLMEYKEQSEQMEQEKSTTAQLEKITSEKSINKEYRNELSCNLSSLYPSSDDSINEEEEPTLSEVGDFSHILPMSGDGDETSNSLSSLYSKWNNPVFVQPPMVGVDISSRPSDGLAVKIHNILFPYRFNKAMVHSMKVIHQVDKKFLACVINTRDDEPAEQSETEADPQVLVGKVPLCFMEKESNELRRGRPSVIKPIVEEYLQEQIELLCSAGRVRGTLPLTVLKVLASLACHGAIKFNDSLSRDECCSLVASLSSCQLPFQCAHGRPSIAPLVDILHLDKDKKALQKPNLQKLRRMYKAWDLCGN